LSLAENTRWDVDSRSGVDTEEPTAGKGEDRAKRSGSLPRELSGQSRPAWLNYLNRGPVPTNMRLDDVRALVARVAGEGRAQFLEPEGFELLDLLGIPAPRFSVFTEPSEIDEGLISDLPGDRVVLKAVASGLLHKTDVGAVRIVPKGPHEVRMAAEEMARSMSGVDLRGFLVQELVPFAPELGSEALLSLRWDREFGSLVTFGIGGTHAEAVTRAMREEAALAIFPAGRNGRSSVEQELSGLLVTDLMTRPQRGRPPRLAMERLVEVVDRLAAAAPALLPELLQEVEINPLVIQGDSLMALDVVARIHGEGPAPAPDRPLEKIECLLRPRSVAVIGVARRLNPGRVILKNLLREGFDPADVYVIKPGIETIEGCRCYEDFAALPKAVDLLIVSVAAEQAPDVLREAIEYQKAETVILIPGGLEEKSGSKHLSEEIRRSLWAARASEWRGPLINGGNSLGIRSQPGGYDTFFLPEYAMPPVGLREGNVALLAQSGAFLASKTSKLPELRIRYAISIGNQIDLTLGDYLTHLADEEEVDLFGVYVEGFRDLDGRSFLEAATRIRKSGRRVVLYRAGRSRSGVEAAASHTAALAGSCRVTRALARRAGVLVADSLADFEDLLMLSTAFADRDDGGARIGAVSNAGYECVAFFDRLERFAPASFSQDTQRELTTIFASSRIDGVVDVRNPLDLTPIVGDAHFEAAVRAVLQDPDVDTGVVGCVPFTGTLNTLAGSEEHHEDVEDPTSIASRLLRVWLETSKPWVAVVDAGSEYDTMVKVLLGGGLPVFRTADRAVRLLEMFFHSASSDG
jgi:acyl-CoA synthetase (NDP forming)